MAGSAHSPRLALGPHSFPSLPLFDPAMFGLSTLCQKAVGRLQAKAASALQQLTHAKHQARFELEKSNRDQQKELAAVKEAGRMEVRVVVCDH